MPVEDASTVGTSLRKISEGFIRSPKYIAVAVCIAVAVKAWQKKKKRAFLTDNYLQLARYHNLTIVPST
jgi:hypothetical protein